MQGPEARLFQQGVNAGELRRLLEIARLVREDDDPEGALSTAWHAVADAPAALLEPLGSGAAPAAALEVLAGVTGVARPKDYGVAPLAEVCWALSDPEDGPATAEGAAADRVMPIALGGSFRGDLQDARPLLRVNAALGVAWAALCAAFDAIGAGSIAGLERLAALADQHPGSPSVTWLDEYAHRLAWRDRRAGVAAARLDGLLRSGGHGRNAAYVAVSVRLGREALAGNAKVHNAWLRVGTMARHEHASVESLQVPDLPRAAVRRAARRGHPLAVMLEEMELIGEHLRAGERTDEEREGPFHGLLLVPPEVEAALDEVAHHGVLGFRETYGLELLRDACPRLGMWLEA